VSVLRQSVGAGETAAAEARRVRSLSASLVRMIGTRAPSTVPAPSAPDMNVSCFTSIFPDSMSGTSRIFALPAMGAYQARWAVQDPAQRWFPE
jgi:hypothetical protein